MEGVWLRVDSPRVRGVGPLLSLRTGWHGGAGGGGPSPARKGYDVKPSPRAETGLCRRRTTRVCPRSRPPSWDRGCGRAEPTRAAQGHGPPRQGRPGLAPRPPAGRRTQRCRFRVSPGSASSGCFFVTNSRSFSAGTTHSVATAFSHVTPMSIHSANRQP